MTSTIIVVAMAVVLALMIVVMVLLRRQSLASARSSAATQTSDFSDLDLHERLSKISLPARAATGDVVISPPSDDDDPLLEYRRSASRPAAAPSPGDAARSAAETSRILPAATKQPFAAGGVETAKPGQILPPASPAAGSWPSAETQRPDSTRPSVAPGFGALSSRQDPGRALPGGQLDQSPASRLSRLAHPGTRDEQGWTGPQPGGSGEGLSPLAARSLGRDLSPQVPGPTPSAKPPASSQQAAQPGPGLRPSLPGKVSSEPGGPAGSGPRLGLPGTVAGGFTMPSQSAQAAAEPALSFTQASAAAAPVDAAGAQALDIRAILRGESVPRGLPGTVADFAGAASGAKPKPQFTTGPLPPTPQQSGPVGAVPFSASLLNVIDPRTYRTGTEAADLDAQAESGDRALGPGTYRGSVERIESDREAPDLDATRPVDDFDLPDTGFETHVFSTTELIDGEVLLDLDAQGPESTIPLDLVGGDTTEHLSDPSNEPQPASASTHVVPAYDVPESHARAGLVAALEPEAEPRSSAQPMPDATVMDADSIDAALRGIVGESETVVLADEPVASSEISAGHVRVGADVRASGETGGASVHISPIQETRAHDLMRDLAGSTDVVFVRLIAPQGVLLAAQGAENGDMSLDGSIAAAMQNSVRETGNLGLGEPHYLAIESEKAAMLVAPVAKGVVLAVYMSNPARLGLLRRQVRKPVLGLTSLLMESRVS